jgi:hypothetical protein
VLIEYVSAFVPKQSGENFNPHVSTGVATKVYLDKMLAEPFESFTFSPAGAAVYQLGPYGTARQKTQRIEFEALRQRSLPDQSSGFNRSSRSYYLHDGRRT